VPHDHRLNAHLRKRLLGQAQFTASDNRFVVDHVEGGQNVMAIGAHFDFRQCLESFSSVHGAISVQIGDVLVVGVDPDFTQCELCLEARLLVVVLFASKLQRWVAMPRAYTVLRPLLA